MLLLSIPQVVAIMSKDSWEEYVRKKRDHDRTVREVLSGAAPGLPELPAAGGGQNAPRTDEYVFEEGNTVCAAGMTNDAMALFDEEILRLAPEPASEPRQAATLLQKAMCLRRAYRPAAAIEAAEAALKLCPRYSHALFVKAQATLDAGDAAAAVAGFEALLVVDREWPGLADWLVFSHARARRHAGAAGALKAPCFGSFKSGSPCRLAAVMRVPVTFSRIARLTRPRFPLIRSRFVRRDAEVIRWALARRRHW